MIEQQRSYRNVPKRVVILLILALFFQIIMHDQLPKPHVQIEAKLTEPPKKELLRVLSVLAIGL